MWVNRERRRSFMSHEGFYWKAYEGLLRVLRVPQWVTVWVNLSSPVGTDQSKLTARHRELARRVESLVAPFEYLGVRTSEGNGVIHAVWVFTPRKGKRVRVPSYQWLSARWSEVLPGALNSRFRIVGRMGHDDIRLARYLAGQKGYVRSFSSEGWNGLVELAGVVGGDEDLTVRAERAEGDLGRLQEVEGDCHNEESGLETI